MSSVRRSNRASCARRASASMSSGSRASSSSARRTACSSGSSGRSTRSGTSRSAMWCSISARFPASIPRRCLSLVKLRNYCEEHGVTLGFSGLSDSMRASFERAGFFGGSGPIKSSPAATRPSSGARTCCSCITRWVRPRLTVSRAGSQSEFGGKVDFPRIASFMEHQELKEGEFLFRQGEAADFGRVASLGQCRHHHHRRA